MLIAPLLVLAACGDPRTACINKATKDLGVVQSLIAQTQLNIDRGYAVETRTSSRISTNFCIGSGRRNLGLQICNRSEPTERRVPVAIDLRTETEKLRSLKSKEAELRAASANKIQRCELEFPKSSQG